MDDSSDDIYNYRVRSLQDQKISKTFKDFFCLLSKTFQRPFGAIRCRKIAIYKHHFYQVISPVKSQPKMHFFVDICENFASINLFY